MAKNPYRKLEQAEALIERLQAAPATLRAQVEAGQIVDAMTTAAQAAADAAEIRQAMAATRTQIAQDGRAAGQLLDMPTFWAQREALQRANATRKVG